MIAICRNKKVKGSTIMEVIIAMAILTFCSALAVAIYLNIQKSSLPFFKVKAGELIEKHIRLALVERNYNDLSVKEEEFTVKRVYTTHDYFKDCYVLRVLVFDSEQKKIQEAEQLVYIGG